MRVGIHSGSVVRKDDDFFGAVVNKAARITAIAAPNETWVSDATSEQVNENSHYHFVEAGFFELDGFEGEHLIRSLNKPLVTTFVSEASRVSRWLTV
mgnify:CR=1 FL=1